MRPTRVLAISAPIAALLASAPGLGDTFVSGTIATSTTWTLANSPYVVNGDILVNNTSGSPPFLTIEAGVLVKVQTGYAIRIGQNQGGLSAVGTDGSPITITGYDPGSGPQRWCGLQLLSGLTAPSTLTFATVSYGGTCNSGTFEGNVVVQGGTPTLDHVSFQYSNAAGLKVSGSTTNPTIINCTFTANTTGLVNGATSNRITAKLSWWNASDGPSGSGPGTGQTVSAGVAYEPWLLAAPSGTFYFTVGIAAPRKFDPAIATCDLHETSTSPGRFPSSKITIKNAEKEVVRAFQALYTTDLDVAWDGTISGGHVLPDGQYTYLFEIFGPGGAFIQAQGYVFLESLPKHSVSYPGPSDTVSNVYNAGGTSFSVTGTAMTDHLASWILDYGAGAAPTSWTVIATGTTAVTNGTLGLWATGGLANGTYSLRVRVTDTDGLTQTGQTTTTVGHFTASITNLPGGKPQMNVAASETVTYRSIVPVTLTETLTIKNEAGVVKRTLVNAASRTAGTYDDAWGGRGDSNEILPDGGYLYSIVVQASGYSPMTWDLSSQPVGTYQANNDNLGLSQLPFDPFNNQPLTFNFNFPQPTRLTLAVSSQGSVILPCNGTNTICLLNRVYTASGSHPFSWAGTDTTGAYRPDLNNFGIWASQNDASPNHFPKSAVVLYGATPAVTTLQVTPSAYGPASGPQAVSFTLTTYSSQTATIVMTFFSHASNSTLRTITLANQAAGTINTTWDGRADNGMLVAAGGYTVTVTATDQAGGQAQARILTTVLY